MSEERKCESIDTGITPEVPCANAHEVLRRLFDETLPKNAKLDQEVVKVVKSHLGGESLHSRAGYSVAVDLVGLAKKRAAGGKDSCGK